MDKKHFQTSKPFFGLSEISHMVAKREQGGKSKTMIEKKIEKMLKYKELFT